MTDTNPLHRKFLIIRTKDFEVVKEETFTVIPERDPWAIPALRAYADACETEAPQLARDLRALAARWA